MAAPSQLSGIAADTIGKLGARLLRSRHLMRAPIWLYRARLGFLLGQRLLLLEHTGRKTGRERFTVLEVVGHPSPDVYIVASGFGTRAQWYRNVIAKPEVKVSVGLRNSVTAFARPLPQKEADAALQQYVEQHPLAWDTMKPAVESTLGEPISTQNTPLPLVEFAIRQS